MIVVIETNELSKRYRDVQAVDALSLQVFEGEIYAFLGLNGAGKTTTVRLLLGMIKPNMGYANVLSKRIQPGKSDPWAEVGYMVEDPHAYPELTVYENLEVARRLHPGVRPKAISEIIERMRLSAYADRRARTLSHGNAQRLGLAKAMIHHPRLLILDEPANGLDPAGIVEIREQLISLSREEGVTIFMSSHILAEVALLADRIGIIHKGRLLQELSVDELERKRKRRLMVDVRDAERGREALVVGGITPEILQDGSIVVTDPAAIESPEQIASLLVNAGAPPSKLYVDEEGLEQYFLRLVGAEQRSGNEQPD